MTDVLYALLFVATLAVWASSALAIARRERPAPAVAPAMSRAAHHDAALQLWDEAFLDAAAAAPIWTVPSHRPGGPPWPFDTAGLGRSYPKRRTGGAYFHACDRAAYCRHHHREVQGP